MIQLLQLSCESKDPPLQKLNLVVPDNELVAVVCADDDERMAFYELLSGYRAETGGQFSHNGQVLDAEARKLSVYLLPRASALSDLLSAAEHVEMIQGQRGLPRSKAQLQEVLAFARIPDAKMFPRKMSEDNKLRLTVGFTVMGKPALVLALDPPPPIVALLPALTRPERALLLLCRELPAGVAPSQVYTLTRGRLHDASQPHTVAQSAMAAPQDRRQLHLKLGKLSADPQALLTHYPDVTVQVLAKDQVTLNLAPDVSVSQLMRALVQGGVVMEGVKESARWVVRSSNDDGFWVGPGSER
jgi:hypothetical protein